MNSTLFYTAISQLFITLIMSVTFFYAIYKVSTAVLKKCYLLESAGNEVITILVIGILLATGILLSASISPIQSIARIIQGNILLTLLKYNLYFGVLGIFIVLCIFLITLSLFGKLLDVRQVLNNNYIYVAIMLSMIVISLTIIARENYIMLLERLIPYPTIPNYF